MAHKYLRFFLLFTLLGLGSCGTDGASLRLFINNILRETDVLQSGCVVGGDILGAVAPIGCFIQFRTDRTTIDQISFIISSAELAREHLNEVIFIPNTVVTDLNVNVGGDTSNVNSSQGRMIIKHVTDAVSGRFSADFEINFGVDNLITGNINARVSGENGE